MSLEIKDQLTPNEAKDLEPIPDSTNVSLEDTKLFFESIFQSADQSRKPRQHVWEKAWDLYNGRVDWTGKADAR